LAKISSTSAKTIIPRISAATPMLFRKVSSRTPTELIAVDTARARIDRNDHMLRNAIGLGAKRSIPHSDDMTYGTVAATAVTVRTPAQK
jgi:hypothetical protein